MLFVCLYSLRFLVLNPSSLDLPISKDDEVIRHEIHHTTHTPQSQQLHPCNWDSYNHRLWWVDRHGKRSPGEIIRNSGCKKQCNVAMDLDYIKWWTTGSSIAVMRSDRKQTSFHVFCLLKYIWKHLDIPDTVYFLSFLRDVNNTSWKILWEDHTRCNKTCGWQFRPKHGAVLICFGKYQYKNDLLRKSSGDLCLCSFRCCFYCTQ